MHRRAGAQGLSGATEKSPSRMVQPRSEITSRPMTMTDVYALGGVGSPGGGGSQGGTAQAAGSPACSALSGRSDWTLPRATRASAMAPLCAHTHTGSGRRVSRGSPWDA